MNEHKRKLSLQRQNSRKIKTYTSKREEQMNLTDGQHDAKTYRIIMHKFIKQLNILGKTLKSCLGELDDNSYKIVLSKEEKLFQQQNMKYLVQKNIETMKKQMLYRNSQIQKTRNEYKMEYEKYFDIESEDETKKNDEFHEPVKKKQQQTINVSTQLGEKRYRPNSSIGMRAKSNNVHNATSQKSRGKWERLIKNSVSESTNMDDPEAFDTEPNECLILKREKEKNSFYSNRNCFIPKNSRCKFEQKTINSTTMNRFFHRNLLVQEKKEQKKSIQEISREKIQNKLVMINTSLAINLIQSQGYKPKGKCWRPTFPAHKNSVL